MKKQEAIKKLESLKMIGKDERAHCYNEAIKASILVIKQLEEPQKPVVPKFVADYIEEYRGEEATLYEMMDNSEDEVYTWLFGNPRIETENERQLLFAQACAVGYEVEKEPLWAIKNAQGNYLTKCDLWGKDGVNYSFECNPSDKLLFTDKLIADAAALLVNGTAEQEQA